MKNFLNSYKKTFDFKYLYLIIKSKQKTSKRALDGGNKMGEQGKQADEGSR